MLNTPMVTVPEPLNPPIAAITVPTTPPVNEYQQAVVDVANALNEILPVINDFKTGNWFAALEQLPALISEVEQIAAIVKGI